MEVRLYDANGLHVGGFESSEDPPRDGVVESGGKTYLWNQRNGQWREASGTFTARFGKAPPAEAPSVTTTADGVTPPKPIVMTNVAGAEKKT